MKRLICFFKRHIRGKTKVTFIKCANDYRWQIQCARCGYRVVYFSPRTRLISEELKFGFIGE